jgi:hypothetical protein
MRLDRILRRLSMIPYMNLNEQVDADFTRARRRARLRAVVARIRREHTSNRLLSPSTMSEEGVSWLTTASTEGRGS